MEPTIVIDLQKAKQMYPSAEGQFKKMLEDHFGADALKENIEEKIHSLEDACAVIGEDPADYIPYPNPKNGAQRCGNAFMFFIAMAKAFNQGKKKDWKNAKQYKYFPWWRMDGNSGSGLSFGDTASDNSLADVASRLMVLEQKHVEIMAKRFPKQYEDLMTEND